MLAQVREQTHYKGVIGSAGRFSAVELEPVHCSAPAPRISHRLSFESMPDQQLPEIEEGDEQRRDAMLLKLLKTPPQLRPKRATLKKPTEAPLPELVEGRKVKEVAKAPPQRQDEKSKKEKTKPRS